MKYKTKSTIFSILAFLIILGGTILAGSLIPTGPVGTPTMYTLSDIYNKLTIPSYTSSPTHTVSTTSSPTTGTFKTLTEIWSAIPSYLTGDINNATSTRSGTTLTLTIPRGISDGTDTLSTTSAGLIEGNIKKDANIFGVVGNYKGAGPATLTWSDAVAGLCWDTDPDSEWNIGNEANEGGAYCDAGALGGWLTTPNLTHVGAVEYCTHLNTAGTALQDSIGIWSLPTESQLLAGLSDQFVLALPSQTGFRGFADYWSSSEGASAGAGAWSAVSVAGYVGSNSGNKYYRDKSRCVH